MRRQNTENRFWSKVEKRGPEKCWNWTGTKSGGYGMMMFRRKSYTAHRLSYIFTFGEFDETLDCCHHCDNPLCCNPNHLFLGTAKDNIHDAITKGRFPKGSKNGKSVLDEETVIEIRKIAKSRKQTMRAICKRFAISKSCLYCLMYGRTWKHV